MPVKDLVFLIVHENDIAVECLDLPMDADLVLKGYGYRGLFFLVLVEHSIEEVLFHALTSNG